MVEAEEEESLEVVVADAVAYPRAVVVHFWDANIANAAVVRAQRFPVAALLAVHVLVWRRRLWDHFWLFEGRHGVGEQRHEDEAIEEDFDEFAVNLVGHPLVHLVVHQVQGHRVENDNNEAHDKDKNSRDHIVSKYTAENAVAHHTHLFGGGFEPVRK